MNNSEKMSIRYLIMILIIGFNCNSVAGQSCTTPLRRNGYCVKTDDCPPIKSILDNPRRTKNDVLLIKDSYCRTESRDGKYVVIVCCDNDVVLTGCILPEYPKNGNYTIIGGSAQVGERVAKGTVLRFKCDGIANDDPYDNSVYCQENREWSNKITCSVLSEETLKKQLNITTSLFIWKYAVRNHLENLMTDVIVFIKNNFDEISRLPDFLKLENQQVWELLQSNVTAVSDMLKYKALKQWFEHNLSIKKQNLNLLDLINLACLPHNFLESEQNLFCNTDEKCLRKFTEALDSQKDFDSLNCELGNTLIVVGQNSVKTPSSIEIYDLINEEWILIEGLKYNEVDYSATLFNNKLMLVGGLTSSRVELHDLKTGEKEILPNLKHNRSLASLVNYNGNIYAIGGVEEFKSPQVEKFNSNLKTWEEEASLNVARRVLGAGIVGNEIFIVGGDDRHKKNLHSTEVYSSSTKKWNFRKSMNEARYGPGVAVVGGYLYAVGGVDENLKRLNTAERYDHHSDTWASIPSMNFPRSGSAAGNLKGKLVVAGGWDPNNFAMSSVEVYDPEKNQWELMVPLKKSRGFIQLVDIPWSLAKTVLSKKTL